MRTGRLIGHHSFFFFLILINADMLKLIKRLQLALAKFRNEKPEGVLEFGIAEMVFEKMQFQGIAGENEVGRC